MTDASGLPTTSGVDSRSPERLSAGRRYWISPGSSPPTRADHGVRAALKRGDELKGDFDRVKGVLDGVEFDILPPLVPLGHGETLRVVDLPTLIHLKLRTGGPQDVLDVAMWLQSHPTEAARAGELATAFGLAAQLESFTKSPRIRAKRPNSPLRRSGRSKSP